MGSNILSEVYYINNSSLQAEYYLNPSKLWYLIVGNMKLDSLVILLILTRTVQESRTEEMPAINVDKRPFQIYPIDVAAHRKVVQFLFLYWISFIKFSLYLQTTANIQVLRKFLNGNTRKNETDCNDLFSRVVTMTMETLRLEEENAKLKLENLHLQQKVAFEMFHKLKI